eukprot:scaffold82386_cov72-Phaeocystis_antarctica.AAC.4
MRASVAWSTLAVASSMTRMLARRSSARAMHSSCRSPAERLPPASATPASSPPSCRTLASSPERRSASQHAASEVRSASSSTGARLYLRLPLKSTGSCWMIERALRSRGSPKPRWSTPSIRMRPAASSTTLKRLVKGHGERALASAGAPHDADARARRHLEREAIEDGAVRRGVLQPHVAKLDGALARPQCQGGAEVGAKQQGRVCLGTVIVFGRQLVRILLHALHVVHADLELCVDAEEPHEGLPREGLHELRGVGEREAGVATAQTTRLPQHRRHHSA